MSLVSKTIAGLQNLGGIISTTFTALMMMMVVTVMMMGCQRQSEVCSCWQSLSCQCRTRLVPLPADGSSALLLATVSGRTAWARVDSPTGCELLLHAQQPFPTLTVELGENHDVALEV